MRTLTEVTKSIVLWSSTFFFVVVVVALFGVTYLVLFVIAVLDWLGGDKRGINVFRQTKEQDQLARNVVPDLEDGRKKRGNDHSPDQGGHALCGKATGPVVG